MTITINNKTLELVEVPEDAKDIEVIDGNSVIPAMLHWKGSAAVMLSPGSYTLLFKASEATEQQAGEIVEYRNEVTRGYVDYGKISWLFTTATESLHSLIRSLGMEVDKTIILKKVK